MEKSKYMYPSDPNVSDPISDLAYVTPIVINFVLYHAAVRDIY